jgi:hypothetical protein
MLATYERNPAGRVTATPRIYFFAVSAKGSIEHSLPVVDDAEREVVSIYLDDNDLVIVSTARKHGIEDADIRHAVRQPIRVFRLDELTMLIGPSEVLEVIHMPRSIQEILEHAEELARQFEDFDPEDASEILVEEYVLQRAVVARARSERYLIEAVAQARSGGLSWQRIGEMMGTSAQAAQQRYAPLLESA